MFESKKRELYMEIVKKYYPNLTWSQFAVCNDDATGAFEDLIRRLFSLEFLEDGIVPHSDHNNPGVEVLPILERPHSDGSKQRKISFIITMTWKIKGNNTNIII